MKIVMIVNRFDDIVVLCIILLLVPALLAHKNKGHNKEHTEEKPVNVCHYRSTTGVDYDLRLLENNAVTDYQYFDSSTGSTFYLRPCAAVKATGCDEDASVCMVNSAGKGVNYGSLPARWADGAAPGSIEATYGNGETCDNGVNRKTVVTYVCSLNSPTAISSVTIGDCYVEFEIQSPFACPVANYCASIENTETCEAQDGLCKWANGKCESKMGCLGWKHMSHASALFLIILLTCTGVLLACTLCLCVCACRKRRARCRQMQARRLTCRGTTAKTNKVEKKRTAKKAQDVEYAPFQMPFQLVPGGFAPINPYSNIQGYPMVTFVAPQTEPEQQV